MQQPTRTTPAYTNRSCFPSQLYAMLQQAEDDGMSSVVSWLPHGYAFKVHCKEAFEQNVLPLWFNHSNYNSFQRQLNIYGFRRFPKGRDKDAYYHQDFVRGEYQQTFHMERNAIKGTGVRRSGDSEAHPDFYQQQRDRADDPHVPTATTSSTPSVITRGQPEPASAPQLPIAPLFRPPDIICPSSNPYDTHIQNYLRTNRRALETAKTASTAMRPNPYGTARNSLLPDSEILGIPQPSATALLGIPVPSTSTLLGIPHRSATAFLGIPRLSATFLNPSSILARPELPPMARTEVLLSQALRDSVVEEMIQSQALWAALEQQRRQHESPIVAPLTSRNHPPGHVPPALRPEEVADLLVRHRVFPPRGAGL